MSDILLRTGSLTFAYPERAPGLFRRPVLREVVKRVDLAAYESFKTAMAGSWQPGISVLGLKEGGVDWALDQYNEKLISPEMKTKVDQAKADIISGKIKVHDYMSDHTCIF